MRAPLSGVTRTSFGPVVSPLSATSVLPSSAAAPGVLACPAAPCTAPGSTSTSELSANPAPQIGRKYSRRQLPSTRAAIGLLMIACWGTSDPVSP